MATSPLVQSSTLLPTVTAISDLLAASITSAQAATMTSGGDSESRPGAKGGECQLLGEASIFIQGALGGLALLSLVYKRWKERPQRPLKIWFFDVSKQVIGSVLLHIANLLMSLLSSGNPPESIQSGNYGRPARATWWLKQSFIYFIGLLGMKACVFAIFQLCPWIIRVGDWALKWTEGNATVQVFFVMLFFPVVMNALQYYIIDGFIKNQKPTEVESSHYDDDVDEDGRIQRPRARGSSEHIQNVQDGAAAPDEAAAPSDIEGKPLLANGVTKLKINPKRLEEYDPATDGEDSPTLSAIRRRNSPGGNNLPND
ncbi:MAG: hypothetical protein Q9222_000145 [Ikaeria aurantiellina]